MGPNLQHAINNNEELNKLLHGVTIVQGGLLPNIQAVKEIRLAVSNILCNSGDSLC